MLNSNENNSPGWSRKIVNVDIISGIFDMPGSCRLGITKSGLFESVSIFLLIIRNECNLRSNQKAKLTYTSNVPSLKKVTASINLKY